jgi:hypothetical protein
MMMDNLKPLASSEVSEKKKTLTLILNKINHYYKISWDTNMDYTVISYQTRKNWNDHLD